MTVGDWLPIVISGLALLVSIMALANSASNDGESRHAIYVERRADASLSCLRQIDTFILTQDRLLEAAARTADDDIRLRIHRLVGELRETERKMRLLFQKLEGYSVTRAPNREGRMVLAATVGEMAVLAERANRLARTADEMVEAAQQAVRAA